MLLWPRTTETMLSFESSRLHAEDIRALHACCRDSYHFMANDGNDYLTYTAKLLPDRRNGTWVEQVPCKTETSFSPCTCNSFLQGVSLERIQIRQVAQFALGAI